MDWMGIKGSEKFQQTIRNGFDFFFKTCFQKKLTQNEKIAKIRRELAKFLTSKT